MKRSANAVWEGSIKEGKGNLTTQSNALDKTPYNFVSRFESGSATNPEELLAAAHAGCFSMMLSHLLSEANFTAKRIESSAEVHLDPATGTITASHLSLTAEVPDISKEAFAEIAKNAKQNCPVSKLFNADITLKYELL